MPTMALVLQGKKTHSHVVWMMMAEMLDGLTPSRSTSYTTSDVSV
jgi:hypothetical protein